MRSAFGAPSALVYVKRFGSWNAALSAAGLPLNRKGGRYRRWTDSEILEALKALAEKLGRRPVHSDFVSRDPAEVPSLPLIQRRFGSFKKALEAAGIAGLPDRYRARRRALLESALPAKPFYLASEVAEAARYASVPYCTLRRFAAESGVAVVNDPLSRGRYFAIVASSLRDGRISRESLFEAMGPRSFAFFEEVLAGKTLQEIGASAGLSRERVRQVLLKGCRRAAEALGLDGFSDAGVERLFGIPAGPSSGGRPRLWTEEKLLDALRKRAVELGRVPKVADVRPSFGTASARTYALRFGSWKAALSAAGLPPEKAALVLLKPGGLPRGVLSDVLRLFRHSGFRTRVVGAGADGALREEVLGFLSSDPVAAFFVEGCAFSAEPFVPGRKEEEPCPQPSLP